MNTAPLGVAAHHRMYIQEVWAIDRQIAALEEVAKYQSGTTLARAITKLAHVVIARDVWLSRIDPESGRPDELWPRDWTLAQLRETVSASQQRWGRFLDRLTADGLSREIDYESYEGKAWTNTLEEILLHVWSHGFYHRGQVGALINELGGTPPAIDFIVHARVSPGE
ncbi:MAG: DinB family protein [Planctomycetota bacterium]